MVDDYDYEYRRRRPRRTTYEGSYRRPGQSEYFNPGADILAGIESIEKSIGERRKKVTDFENTAALETQKYQDSLADTESMEDTGAVDSLQQGLSDKILELNRLKIASFEGDQTEYLKKSSELNRYIETLPTLMGLIDEEAKTTKDARLNGTFNKEYLKSNNKKYLDFIDAINDGGKGVTFDTRNGNIIAKLNGKEVFNGNAYIKGKKEGFDLINYADGYQEQIDQADAQAYKGLENLVRKDIIKGVEKGDKITGEIAKNYAEARQKYKERLLSGEIAIPINESTYQKYTKFGSEDPDILSLQWGKDIGTQSKLTKKAIIDSMVENRFPGGDRVVVQTTEEARKKPTTKSSGSSDSSYIPDVDNIIKGISDLKNDTEKGKTYFIGKKIKGREIKSVKVDGNVATFTTRSMTQGGKVVEKEENYNLNNSNSINNLEDDLIKTIIGGGRDAQKARDYAHRSTSQLLSGEEDFSIPEQVKSLTIEQWKASEEDLVGGEDKDDEDYEKGTLYQLYPGFKFEQSGFGTNRIIAKTKDGKNKTKELTPGKEDDLKILLDFVEKHSNNDKTDSSARAKALIDKYKK